MRNFLVLMAGRRRPSPRERAQLNIISGVLGGIRILLIAEGTFHFFHAVPANP